MQLAGGGARCGSCIYDGIGLVDAFTKAMPQTGALSARASRNTLAERRQPLSLKRVSELPDWAKLTDVE